MTLRSLALSVLAAVLEIGRVLAGCSGVSGALICPAGVGVIMYAPR